MKSLALYYIETSPLREQMFNSYMDEAVALWHEEWTAQVQSEMHSVLNPIWLSVYLNQRWLEMVRDN